MIRALGPLARASAQMIASILPFAAPASSDWTFYPGDYSQSTIIGNSLPGTWRPFSSSSPWNTPIGASPTIHVDSAAIMATLAADETNIRFGNSFLPPIWVVRSDNLPQYYANSSRIFDTWDQDEDGTSDVKVPVTHTMYAEPTVDGHIIILDPFKLIAWEMSKFTGLANGFIECSTFNIWDLTGSGVGDTNEGERWFTRGGRGSGFPVIAGLLRPEEVLEGVIQHPLTFTFASTRFDEFVSPAVRTDGEFIGNQYPMLGMRFQLDPTLTDTDFDSWGLGTHAKVLAKALQDYGMILGDTGGSIALQVQLLDEDPAVHRTMWDTLVPDLYADVQKIPTVHFRVIDTGASTTGGLETTVVAPLVTLVGGPPQQLHVTMATPTPGATIRYTTDGSDPDATSTLYTGPFQTGPPTTLKARAFGTAMTDSPVTRAPDITTLALFAVSPAALGAVVVGILTAGFAILHRSPQGHR